MHSKYKISIRIVFIGVFSLICLNSLFAQFGGGTGTEADPYLIATPTHLNNVRSHANDCFRQTSHINLDVTPYNGGTGWNPIGTLGGTAFTGKYNGDGFYIHNLFINRPNNDCVGLFGFTDGARLLNIDLQTFSVNGNSGIGGLVGLAMNSIITRCNATGSITSAPNGGNWLGGLVGRLYLDSEVDVSFANVSITGNTNLGGLVGECDSSAVTRSFASGDITCYANAAGGLVGKSVNSNISCSYALGDTGGPGIMGGGLIGDCTEYSRVSNCFARGSVSNLSDVGGLIGSTGTSVITNCYSTGYVTGLEDGGLIGSNSGSVVTRSYWDTQTSHQNLSGGGDGRTTEEMVLPYASDTYVRWVFTGIWTDDINASINDGYPYLIPLQILLPVDTPVFSRPAGSFITPFELTITTETPDAAIYYTLNGSEPTEQSALYTAPLSISTSTYVKARAYKEERLPSEVITAFYGLNIFPAGTGTEDDPYQIVLAEQLDNVRLFPDAHYRQIANINLNTLSSQWEPIGTFEGLHSPENVPFTGTFDGQGCIISNMQIFGAGVAGLGLFSMIDRAILKNIILANVNVDGTDAEGCNTVGGITGYCLESEITNCSVSGTVAGNMEVGGLVGRSRENSRINDCSTSGAVSGNGDIGGLVGINEFYSILDNCHSTSSVTANYGYAGGLIGENLDNAKVQFCSATGNVSAMGITGGLIGLNDLDSKVSNCYANGSVTANSYAGGLIGSNDGNSDISNSYAAGQVNCSDHAGGLIGSNTAGSEIDGCYWDTETTGQAISAGGDGRTTDEMTFPYAENTYTGWDFTNVWMADNESNVNSGYPYFTENPVLETEEDNLIMPKATLRSYPNPFNPTTMLHFNLPKALRVNLIVYNLKGQKVCTLAKDTLCPAGENTLNWNGLTDNGSSLPSGVYLVKLSGSGYNVTHKMTLLK